MSGCDSAIYENPEFPPHLLLAAACAYYNLQGPRSAQLNSIAGNPNTPLEVLQWLLPWHPYRVMLNPVVPLLFMEQPECFHRSPAFALQQILCRADAPAVWARILLEHPAPEVATAARLHVSLAKQDGDWRAELREELGRQPLVRSDHWLALEEIGAAPSGPVTHPARKPGARRLRSGANAASTKPGVLSPVEGMPPNLRVKRARDPAASPEELFILAADTRSAVREAVASNPSTPHEIRMRLVEDPSRTVWERLAKNPTSEAQVLLRLSERRGVGDLPLVERLAKHPHATAELLEQIWRQLARQRNSGFPSREVRRAAAAHPELPAWMRRELLRDTDPVVQVALFRRQDRTEEEQATLQRRVLEEAARAPEPLCRYWALSRAGTPLQVLERAAASLEWSDRLGVLLHPEAPRTLVLLLSEDGNRLVRATALVKLAGEPLPDTPMTFPKG